MTEEDHMTATIKPPEQHAEEIRARLKEIETETTAANRTLTALASEQHGLEGALAALKGTERAVEPKGRERAVAPKGSTRRPAIRNGSDTLSGAAAEAKTAQARKRGRPKGTGKRPAQIIQILSHGPKDVRGIAEALGIKPNYLYRVLPEMQEQGIVLKVSDGTWALDPDRPQEA